MHYHQHYMVQSYKKFQIQLITGLYSLIYPKYYTSGNPCISIRNYGQPITGIDGFLEKYEQSQMNNWTEGFCHLNICYCQRDIQDEIILAENTLHLLNLNKF